MHYDLSRSDARLSSVLYSPIERLKMVPAWEFFVSVGAAAQYVYHDAFLFALVLVFAIGVVDYVIGVRGAKLAGTYSAVVAHRGAMGKISGLVLLCALRTLEHYLQMQGIFPNSHGMVASAVAISLFAVDLQSIAHHREEFGAQSIPILGRVLDLIQRFAASRLPDSAGKP